MIIKNKKSFLVINGVYIPDIKEQEAFCKYVEKTSTKRDELMKKIAMTKTNKQGAIDQYFK